MSNSSSPHTSSSMNDMSCYTNETDEFTELASLQPSLFGQGYQGATSEYCSSIDYATTMHNHNSPTGSAGHTSPHSDGSEEHRWHNVQMPIYPPYQQFYPPTHYPSYMTSPPMMPIGPPTVSEPISKRRTPTASTTATKKRKTKKDPNEPNKPVSAYALFFRDTQATIKGQNPNASFGEISKIVASMWDNILPDDKDAYKLRTEMAKKEYLKNLAAYRANLVNCGAPMDMRTKQHVQFLNAQHSVQQLGSAYHQLPQLHSEVSNNRSVLNHDSSNIHPASAAASQTMSQRAHAMGSRSLASLIAEPTTAHMLTATTTLTVPQGCYAQQTNWMNETGQMQRQYSNDWSDSQQVAVDGQE